MTRRIFTNGIALITLALLPGLAATGWAGDSKSQFSAAGSAVFVSPPCPAKQFPTFESIVPVPRFIDPFEQDLIPFFCEVLVGNEGKGVKKVKGKYEVDLVVVDNKTGMAESFSVGGGKFRTKSDGSALFDFDLPSELFADGFESGDVSAWSYTRTDFTNRKSADGAQVQCGTSASRSD